jgi:hypothetical protein
LKNTVNIYEDVVLLYRVKLLSCIAALFIFMCVAPGVSAEGGRIFGEDFDGGIPETFIVETTGGGVVENINGRVMLLCSNEGGSGIKIAKISTPSLSLPGSGILYFKLEASTTTGTKIFGVTKSGVNSGIISIAGTSLSVAGNKVMDITGKEYEFALSYNSETVTLYADGEKIYEGVNTVFSGTVALYYSMLIRSAGEVSHLYIDDLFAWQPGSYQPFLENGDIVPSGNVRLKAVFGTPLLKPPSTVLESVSGQEEVDVSFLGDTVNIDATLLPNTAYTLNLDEIYDFEGTAKEPLVFTFQTTPEGYDVPVVTVTDAPQNVRVGSTVIVSPHVDSAQEIIRCELYVNRTVADSVSGIGDLSFTPIQEGTYLMYVKVYDSMAYGTSEEWILNTEKNTPPVIDFDVPGGGTIPYTSPHEFSFNVTDDIFVERVEASINGIKNLGTINKSGDNYTLVLDTPMLGDLEIKITAFDGEGAKSVKVANLAVLGDQL